MWKILCASGDDDVRSEIQKLEQYIAFYTVKFAASADEMFLAAITESYDVYLIDPGMDHEQASDLCKAIRLTDEDAVILCLSNNEADRHGALDAGAGMFLRLPSDLKLLRPTIDDLLDVK